MAHFAKVENGVVTDLIVVRNEDCDGGAFPASEAAGRAHIASLAETDPRLAGEWFQTSYNTRDGVHYPDEVGGFRLNFGEIGFVFDKDAGQYGEFRPPVASE